MTAHINKKNIGILAITLSILGWLADRLTHAISALLGKIIRLFAENYRVSPKYLKGDVNHDAI